MQESCQEKSTTSIILHTIPNLNFWLLFRILPTRFIKNSFKLRSLIVNSNSFVLITMVLNTTLHATNSHLRYCSTARTNSSKTWSLSQLNSKLTKITMSTSLRILEKPRTLLMFQISWFRLVSRLTALSPLNLTSKMPDLDNPSYMDKRSWNILVWCNRARQKILEPIQLLRISREILDNLTDLLSACSNISIMLPTWARDSLWPPDTTKLMKVTVRVMVLTNSEPWMVPQNFTLKLKVSRSETVLIPVSSWSPSKNKKIRKPNLKPTTKLPSQQSKPVLVLLLNFQSSPTSWSSRSRSMRSLLETT